MLGQVKFSEAMSSICPRWRSSSFPSRAAMSGSISSSPATLRCSKVSCATLTGLTLLGAPDEGERRLRADRPLPEDARLRPGEVDDRRGEPGKLAGIEHGSGSVLDL